MTYPEGRSARGRARRVLLAVAREPLVHFVLLAAVLFAIQGAAAQSRGAAREPIVVSDGFVDELAAREAARAGEDPEEVDRDALVDGFRREEALYREARRLGLDQGDPIVRRRLVQKMEFLLESRVEVPEPDDAQLARFLREHADRFRAPATATFDQVFFGGEDGASRAASVLEALGSRAELAAVSSRGDAFPLGVSHGPQPEATTRSRLGDALADAVADAPLGEWTGPVSSEWGAHLVRVRERTEARLPALEAVRRRVRRAWEAERREEALEREVRETVERWPLRRDGDAG